MFYWVLLKMIRRNKKATHVGVIFSFVIFITFLLFMVIILEPTSKIENEKKSTLEYLKTNIENYLKEILKQV